MKTFITTFACVVALAFAAHAGPRASGDYRGYQPSGIDVPNWQAQSYKVINGRVVLIWDCKNPAVWRNSETEDVSCIFVEGGGDKSDDDAE